MPADQPREWTARWAHVFIDREGHEPQELPPTVDLADVEDVAGPVKRLYIAAGQDLEEAVSALTAERKRREEADVALANEIERADAAEGLIDYWNDPAAPGSPAHEIERLRARVEELEEVLRRVTGEQASSRGPGWPESRIELPGDVERRAAPSPPEEEGDG